MIWSQELGRACVAARNGTLNINVNIDVAISFRSGSSRLRFFLRERCNVLMKNRLSRRYIHFENNPRVQFQIYKRSGIYDSLNESQ